MRRREHLSGLGGRVLDLDGRDEVMNNHLFSPQKEAVVVVVFFYMVTSFFISFDYFFAVAFLCNV